MEAMNTVLPNAHFVNLNIEKVKEIIKNLNEATIAFERAENANDKIELRQRQICCIIDAHYYAGCLALGFKHALRMLSQTPVIASSSLNL